MIDERCGSQLLAGAHACAPEDVVAWFGAMQAQDYYGALWALGLRSGAASDAAVEEAVARGAIVRTWPLRGTLHFVAAADVRWLLALLAPRVLQRARGRHAALGIDGAVSARACDAFARALEGGRRLTREGMRQALERAEIDTSGQRGYHLLWLAALHQVICFGPREGKQQTFVLLDEWVPTAPTPVRTREEALAELARRYFQAHGPATLRDFGWWSGLAAGEAREALELARPSLLQETAEEQDFWSTAAPRSSPPELPPRLLPAFDEYLVGYADRGAVLNPVDARRVNAGGGLLSPTVLLDGRVAGVWKRTLAGRRVRVQAQLFRAADGAGAGAVRAAVRAAAEEYAAFLRMPLELSLEEVAGGPAGPAR